MNDKFYLYLHINDKFYLYFDVRLVVDVITRFLLAPRRSDCDDVSGKLLASLEDFHLRKKATSLSFK